MSQSGIYSDLKMAWHMLRDGGLPATPKQVQIILSDLCNQNCSFCLTKNSIVDTEDGPLYIQVIKVGDRVYGPKGDLNEVTATSSRNVEEVVSINIAGNSIEATPEHPILTNRGWIPAGEIRVGDSAVVRVRLRESCQSESWNLEPVHSGASDARANLHVPGRPGENPSAHDCEQPYEESRSRGTGLCSDERQATIQDSTGYEEHLSGGTQENAVQQESHARYGKVPSDDGKDSVPSNQQERNSFPGLGDYTLLATQALRRRNILDRETEPGLSSGRSTEVDRSDSEHVLRRVQKDSDTGGLRGGFNPALSEQGLAMLGGVQEGPSRPDTRATDRSHQGLHITGIQLERGLALRQVNSVRRLTGTFTVYNFSCSPEEAYEANGIVVHNCAYRMDGYTSNELFVGDSPTAKYGKNNPIRVMPGPRAFALLEECKRLGVEGLQFTGGGEPTVHKEHVTIFRRALALGFKCSLVSNGVAWSEELIDNVLVNFSWVRVSLDAGTAETYARIRQTPASNFDRVLRNVRRLSDRIKLCGTDCVLGVGYVVTPDNWKEVRQATRLVKETGAAYIRLSAMFNPDDALPYQEIYGDILKSVRDVKGDYDSSAFTVHELFTDRMQDLFDGAPDYDTCAYQYSTAYVGGDLKAYRCCVLAYNKRGLISGGDLKNRAFDEFWNSEDRKNDFSNFNARGCERCQFNGKNRVVNYLLSVRPKHIEFP